MTDICPLQRLATILKEEASALQALDVAGIDRAAAHKEALAPALAQLLGAPLPPELADLLRDVRGLARENQRRLAATLATVRGLVRALVTDAPSTYGPPSSSEPTKPVLTSVVG